MNLLKIGTLNLPRNRWLDALIFFEKVYVFCWDSEVELEDERFIYIKLPRNVFFNKVICFFISKCNSKIIMRFFQMIFIRLFGFLNRSSIKQIPFDDVEFVHSSYNDFDESNLFTLVLPKKIEITRAQKETRIANNNLEYFCMRRCERIILNDIECQKFFEEKYGSVFFKGKKVLLNLDEDVRYSSLEKVIEYEKKLSSLDGRIHAVILAGRVLSDKNDKRSGGRLYYLDTINNLLDAGFVVHLHTKNIVPIDGKNPYEELAREKNDFIIESALDFECNPVIAYKKLSRYDIGILHAYISTETVSLFDRVNIPHRYYEYLLAHVCPVVPKGQTFVAEKLFLEKHSGFVYKSFSEITLEKLKEIQYDNVFFRDYIHSAYSNL